ncbi:RDD family protein [Flavobacterium sp.]|uniref:RDD family protein n=1 Tax=Flavobacterium sp. TaxID=239 RepID=UPI002606D9C8|nr:RDD family protein [Flavobacterium sp.]
MKQIPLNLNGVHGNIYAGFGPRIAAILLDGLILSPVTLVVMFMKTMGLDLYLLAAFINLIAVLIYNIYLPKRFGATPGKMILEIKIIRLDGQPILWKESYLRYLVMFLFSLLTEAITINAIRLMDWDEYEGLGFLDKNEYLTSMSPGLFQLSSWLIALWVIAGLIVLLSNPRKRATHDFIAGTVVVHNRYLERIRDEMNGQPAENEV